MMREIKESKVLKEQGYRFHDNLGSGGFGIVNSYWQRVTADKHKIETLTTIKTLDPDSPENAREYFFKEAKIALEQRYQHDGLVRGLTLVTDGDLYHLITDYITGSNFNDVIERDTFVEGVQLKRVKEYLEKIKYRDEKKAGEIKCMLENGRYTCLPIEFSSAVVYKIVDVLEFLHNPNIGIIHRDIKPSNIMISNDGKVYLIDFGVAKIGFEEDKLELDSKMTGTPAYASPEQTRGKKTTPQSDLWSLGTTYYEALTGRNPFRSYTKGDDIDTILSRIIKGHFSSPRKFNKKIPYGVATIVKRLLGGKKILGKFSLQHRYDGASELKYDLERILGFDSGNVDKIIKDYVSSGTTFGTLGYNSDVEDGYFEYPNYKHPDIKLSNL
ncbi:MAG: serine/threonine-protein kinase [Nanoarchaeota archaeon]